MGNSGRLLVEEHYSLAHWAKDYARILKVAKDRNNQYCRRQIS